MANALLQPLKQLNLSADCTKKARTPPSASPTWIYVSDEEDEPETSRAQTLSIRQGVKAPDGALNTMSTKAHAAASPCLLGTTEKRIPSQNSSKASERRLEVIVLDDSDDEEESPPSHIHMPTPGPSRQAAVDPDSSDSSIEIVTPSKFAQSQTQSPAKSPFAHPSRSAGPLAPALGVRPRKAPVSFPTLPRETLEAVPSSAYGKKGSTSGRASKLSAPTGDGNSSASPDRRPDVKSANTGADTSGDESLDEGAFLVYDPKSKSKPTARRSSQDATPLRPALLRTSNKTATRTEGKFTISSPAKKSRNSLASDFGSQRDRLCLELVQALDLLVFNGRLPHGLKIIWSKRLNTTAGRARWKQRQDPSTGQKVHESSIELSTKVVDSAQRLKNTLSHELAHVMAWVVDNEIKPPHGPAFKKWSQMITDARPDISISTRHHYSIAFKYSWICVEPSCGKIYGRHSKSIDPTRQACVCGGTLQAMT